MTPEMPKSNPNPTKSHVKACRKLKGPIMGPIGKRLAQEFESGVSLKSLAESMGVHQPTLWRTIDRQTDPKESLLRKICDYFGMQLINP